MESLVLVVDFPKVSDLNSILYDRVCENIFSRDKRAEESLFGRQTNWNFHRQNIKEVDILITWIKKVLPEISTRFASEELNDGYGFDINAFEIAECWGAHYNRGESLVKHNHFPYIISFVYYVRTPKGFSTIKIQDDDIDVKEGQCVFFLAHQYHSVQPNNCDDRCIIAGNILYRF